MLRFFLLICYLVKINSIGFHLFTINEQHFLVIDHVHLYPIRQHCLLTFTFFLQHPLLGTLLEIKDLKKRSYDCVSVKCVPAL